jgi:hypothetical protein
MVEQAALGILEQPNLTALEEMLLGLLEQEYGVGD